MHSIEKIMARASGRRTVRAGEIINVKVDFAQINDLYLQTINSFYEMGGQHVWDCNKVAFVLDHYAPAPTIQAAENQHKMREFAQKNQLTHHFDINMGVCHQVLAEEGVTLPGKVIVATDSHATTNGALGALGIGVGATDMATILISGELWLRVPEVIEIRIEGQPGKGVYPKDVILYVLGRMKANGAVYKAIDFTGSYVEQLDISGRMVLCNMAVEMGAKTGYVHPNGKVLNFIDRVAAYSYELLETDPDYEYSSRYIFEVSDIAPQVAVPHSVDDVRNIDAIEPVKIDQGFIGSCTGGRSVDFEAAAAILKGKKITPYTRLIMVPASTKVFMECMENGIVRTLLDAGATFATPGCGPCLGAHNGVLAPEEVCITASNRNFLGRMGSNKKTKIYLASPATVAASVLNGFITDPRTINNK